ncbi:MAG: beta-ketoacyl-ACP reductase, partial [Pyrinomonadaceae bacterium]|nr:beta-ketoacyl-ACP reductase [Sphingobacteriaceae bacterium]
VLCSGKWMTGHTLGASGCLTLDYAIWILKTQTYLGFPYDAAVSTIKNKPINRILITAVGFGGNAAAIIVSRVRSLLTPQ